MPVPGPPWSLSRPCASGSGKFGTPCERMHAENEAGPEACEPPLVLEPLVAPRADGVVVGACATPGPAEPPPQPASTSARPAAAASTTATAARRGVLCVVFTSSPSSRFIRPHESATTYPQRER